MVDKATFRRIKPNWPSMGLPTNSADIFSFDDDFEGENYDEDDTSDGDHVLGPRNGRANERHRSAGLLTDEDYILATPIVYGFALDDKRWVEFNIDLVEPIVWNESAFANLVLPAEKKMLIQALVEAHQEKDRVGFDDFIVGKGQGLVIK